MDIRENKFEWGILFFVLLMMGGMMRLFGSPGDVQAQDIPDISYEMPRPKDDLLGEFALSGREIDRRYINPFEKKGGPAAAANNAKDAKGGPAAAAAAKKAVAKTDATAAKTSGTWYKNPFKSAAGDGAKDPNFGAGNKTPTIAAAPAPDDEAPKDHKATNDRRSPAQWRSLLLAQPTKANMDLFIDAYEKNQVDSTTFYSINRELLKSGKKDEAVLALYAFQKVGTAQAFSTVAQDYSSLPADIQAPAQQFLMSYGNTARVTALKTALQSSDGTVALLAAKVVLNALQGGGQSTTTDPRQVRGSSASGSAASYASFAAIFQRWSTSGNSTLQSIALTILPLLQSTQA